MWFICKQADKQTCTLTYVEYLGKSKIALANFFLENKYIDVQGKERPCYLLTKQGCEMVANKMTGEKGVLFTAKYVQAFNQMENYLLNTGLINELRAELTSSIDTIVNDRIQQIEDKCSTISIN